MNTNQDLPEDFEINPDEIPLRNAASFRLMQAFCLKARLPYKEAKRIQKAYLSAILELTVKHRSLVIQGLGEFYLDKRKFPVGHLKEITKEDWPELIGPSADCPDWVGPYTLLKFSPSKKLTKLLTERTTHIPENKNDPNR